MNRRKLFSKWLSSSTPISAWNVLKIGLSLTRINLKSVSKRISPTGTIVGFDIGAQYIQLHDSEPYFSGINHEGSADVSLSLEGKDIQDDGLTFLFKPDPFIQRLKDSLDDPAIQDELRQEHGYYSPMFHPITGEITGVQLGNTNYPFPDVPLWNVHSNLK